MATSLYDLSIATYLQGLAAVSGFLEKGRAYCAEQGSEPDALVETCLHADMLPFRFQVVSVRQHSLGAARAIESGEFRPPSAQPLEGGYAGLQALINETRTEMEAFTADAIDAHAGRLVTFHLGDKQIPFTVENFILSFSLPNFFFHATTAYDILRQHGAPVGKRDYLGRMRIGAPAA